VSVPVNRSQTWQINRNNIAGNGNWNENGNGGNVDGSREPLEPPSAIVEKRGIGRGLFLFQIVCIE